MIRVRNGKRVWVRICVEVRVRVRNEGCGWYLVWVRISIRVILQFPLDEERSAIAESDASCTEVSS